MVFVCRLVQHVLVLQILFPYYLLKVPHARFVVWQVLDILRVAAISLPCLICHLLNVYDISRALISRMTLPVLVLLLGRHIMVPSSVITSALMVELARVLSRL